MRSPLQRLRKLRYAFVAVGLVFLAWTPVGAKTIYSLNGLGDPVRRIDARSLGMGGAGMALADGYNLSMANPALLGAFRFPAMSSRYMLQRRTIKSEDGSSHVMSDGDFGAIRVAFPVKEGTVLGFGLEPLTDLDFGLTDTVSTGPVPHRLTITGTGGVQALSVAFGQRVGQFYVGGRLDMVVLGTVSELWERKFGSAVSADGDPVSPRGVVEYMDTSDQFVRTFRGFTTAFGAIYHPLDPWYIGFTIQPNHGIRQTETMKNFFSQSGIEEGIVAESDVDLPGSFGLGAAYRSGYRWMAAMDFTRTLWAATAPGRYDTIEWSAGGLYRSGSTDLMSRSKRLEYTGGLHYRTLYFATARGGQISEKGLSLGVTVPLKRAGGGRFHYMLEFGSRGNAEKHGLSERYIMQTISLSGFLR
jgi:hypothetical protein